MEENKKELKEQELEAVTGGKGAGSGYNYVNLYFEGGSLILYAGYKVRAIHVYQNNSQIRYTSQMTAGQKETIIFSEAASLQFKVTGSSANNSESFEYYFNFS